MGDGDEAMTTNRYEQLRENIPDADYVIRMFMAGTPVEALMWTVKELPGGSRILFHATIPTILYDGNTDKFYRRNSSLHMLEFAKHGGDVSNDEEFWNRYNDLLFTERLRSGNR